MENIVLNEENGIVISSFIPPRKFDKISVLYKQYLSQEIWDIVLTFEVIKLLLVDKSKELYIDDMLDAKEWVIDLYEVLEDWSMKVLNIVAEMQSRKKKLTQ